MIREFRPDPLSREPELKAGKFDLDKVLPLDLIRQHAKIDDVPSVSDAALVLYRKAALEAAQAYTGLLLTERRVMSEVVRLPVFTSRRRTFRHEAKLPFATPVAYLYGLPNTAPKEIPVEVGSTYVEIDRIFDDFGLGCCNPCAQTATARIQYVAGFACEDDVPAAIALGALKYIAHVVENPGDLVLDDSASTKVNEAADPAYASGAVDIWISVVNRI